MILQPWETMNAKPSPKFGWGPWEDGAPETSSWVFFGPILQLPGCMYKAKKQLGIKLPTCKLKLLGHQELLKSTDLEKIGGGV